MDRSRRFVLGALPAVALLAACGTKSAQTINAQTTTSTTPPRPRVTTPDDAIKVLMDGNARFAARTPQLRDTAAIEEVWTSGIDAKQEPFAMVLGCADSRLAPEIIFDQFVGDIFVVREAGNIANSPTNIGSLEYGQAVLHAKALVVLGHSDCGAVKAAFTSSAPGASIQSIVDTIKPGIAGATTLDDAITRNVGAVIEQVRTRSPMLAEAEKGGGFRIVGAVYDIDAATVRLL
jgi:carbonic anhydrase